MQLGRALSILAFALGVSGLAAPGGAQEPPGRAAFADGFEVATGWKVFEEIVDGNPCYATGIGAVARTTAHSFGGGNSLSVWANQGRAGKSNHLIAYTTFVPSDARGAWRYRARALIPAAGEGRGQTGPELSLQNTRPAAGGGWTTATAGLQYVANPHLYDWGGWHVWAETGPGRASWLDLKRAPVVAGQWYTVTLEVDYGTNSYLTFGLEGPDGLLRQSLAGLRVAEEAKGFAEPAFVLTLESENLWNNCDPAQVFDYEVVYDEVEAALLHRQLLPLIHRGP